MTSMPDSFIPQQPTPPDSFIPQQPSKLPASKKSTLDKNAATSSFAEKKLGESPSTQPSRPSSRKIHKQTIKGGTLAEKIAVQAQQVKLAKTLKGAEGQSELQRLSSTQNPVTKLQTEFFVDLSRIPKEATVQGDSKGRKSIISRSP